MLANILIAIASIALFLYWFRYTCRLILSVRTSQDYSAPVARANQLAFLEVQNRLASPARPSLEHLCERLEQDYALLTYLFTHALELRGSRAPLERRMLMVDFQLMRLWYTLARPHSPERARRALWEMSQIVSHLANSMGEQLSLA